MYLKNEYIIELVLYIFVPYWHLFSRVLIFPGTYFRWFLFSQFGQIRKKETQGNLEPAKYVKFKIREN